MTLTFAGESAEYRAARDRLLEREIELRREMEAVPAARRELPPGGVVPEDYVFQGKAADGNPADVHCATRGYARAVLASGWRDRSPSKRRRPLAHGRSRSAGALPLCSWVALEGGVLVPSRDRLQRRSGRRPVLRLSRPSGPCPTLSGSAARPGTGPSAGRTSSGYSDQEKGVEKPLLPSAE
jgi:hypothetical protein